MANLSTFELDFIRNLINIPSIGGNPEDNAPYGPLPKKALEYFLNDAENCGFKTGTIDNKVGYIEFGSGNKLLGIVCHLDVVPAGPGWTTDPFDFQVIDDNMYGRGIVDDKGPACAAYFAMKELKEAGLNSRVRLILGTDEERSCECVETYAEKGEIPAFSITPDAEFPVIYAEKGILQVKISGKAVSEFKAEGGNAANMVCPEAVAEYDNKKIVSTGKMAHASRPELGINAINNLPGALKREGFDFNTIPLLAFINKYITEKDYSYLTGCDIKDDSGSITLNSGILRINDTDNYLIIDIRYPVTAKLEDIMESIRTKASEFGLNAEINSHMAHLYKDKNQPEIKILSDIWKNHMGNMTGFKNEYQTSEYAEYSEPIAIGGGTYARHLPNTIAFGVQAPWHEDQCHQANEHMAISDFIECKEMIKEALISLSK